MNNQAQYGGQKSMPGIKNTGAQMSYLCAACAKPTEIKPKEPIRCHDCGHRILYKKRTPRMVQFEAR
ncbi:DNA-directed RNA polymerase core subunit rpc10 [Coemansia sp. RSA 1722]|nr:DNA-directed RNA polymerase core subunit rpc10 [Coemansia sp. RSA 486]KAJ2221330.1 DNA-directed RNA polymerase core subunit rpc10 [Coemansia sp. RSA 485]KAJ2587431.1 DNA-directed RNA polymerase core subunit rpc10 [Coemansia sp. RSA 1722]KAJ2634653.1 DNA-directed RNA polymerase core subunit rpc10 [Coemansia sp. RSA 1286]KAJ2704734.1 DNA-directed RNA polymerase core subunit rpc10 [Coemansia sp. IMI 203386]